MTLNQETGLYGAYDLVYEPFFTKPWFIALLISLALLVIVAIAYIVYRLVQSYRESHITPLMRAQKALSALIAECTSKKEAPVSTQFERVITIFKHYWQETASQDVMQYTPKEFSFLLRHYCSQADLKNKIDEFFDSIEYFLFAQQEATCADVERMAHQAGVLLKKIDDDRKLKKG